MPRLLRGAIALALVLLISPVHGAWTTAASAADVSVTDFESGLGGWGARADADGPPQVATTDAVAHGGSFAAAVTGRTTQGDGLGRDVTGVMVPGVTYEVSAWVRFADGAPPAAVWLSLARTLGGATSYDTVGTVTASGWTQVSATYELPPSDSAYLYFETTYPDGTAADLYIDDVVISEVAPPQVQDLPPLQDSVGFPLGVAIDSRETTGAPAELLTRHFGQITPENHMKPSYWYSEDRTFEIHPEAAALMGFARDQGLRVYGHTLVWHQQTPDWFFQAADGSPLTTSEADRQVLRDRLRTHIFGVAQALSTGGGYGGFGSPGNPVKAFDVVNEVIADQAEGDGLRQSEWHRILGEEYIDLAFRYADQAFNSEYADPAATRPVTLFINDYNTEQSGKRQRLHDLVQRLLARGVPVDGVGHQFHISLSTPVQTLDDALTAFDDLPVVQAVTELDVATGTPVTQSLLVDQGYYYRDVFRVLRGHSGSLFSASVWGLYDTRSWRVDQGAPLPFDGRLQAKPAYFGAADAELPPRIRTALVFREDVPLEVGVTRSPTWELLPPIRVGEVADLGLRWEPEALVLRALVHDTDRERGDQIRVTVEDESYVVRRDETADVPAVVTRVRGGWSVVARLPLPATAQGSTLAFDVAVTDGTTTTTWNDPGALGTLSLVEPLSVTEVARATRAPVVDGRVDRAWAAASTLSTGTAVEGDPDGARAEVRTLWSGSRLYVLAEVGDPTIDVTASDPWQRDSVEIFLDVGNDKAGAYAELDTQMRVNADNVTSFGTGDEAAQARRLISATTRTASGYVVEVSIELGSPATRGAIHGLDVQVNDATAGARTSVHTWADPTGVGYLSTQHWGVARFVRRGGPGYV
jgi:endo-1,4-beta-xylanase